MKLCDEIVYHKTFGKGRIIEFVDYHISVLFENNQETKKFKYPDAFDTHLKLDNQKLMKDIQKDKAIIELKIAEKEKEKIEKEKAKGLSKEKDNENKKTIKNEDMCNVAFKCTYCDGGKNKKNIGFYGVCNDETIRYNINLQKHIWCSSEMSDCYRYLNNEITRKELNNIYKENGSVCYESKMLRDWEASAGYHHNGKNKGKPMAMRNVSSNNLALLTTRFPYDQEENRIIFAVFLILENYEGDKYEEGHVKANPKFRLQLTIEEAKRLKFWDFYYNRNKPETVKFGSGLHRYISDIQAAQVLKKICEIKKGTQEEQLSSELLEYYCNLKQIDINEIPEPKGVLKRDLSER